MKIMYFGDFYFQFLISIENLPSTSLKDSIFRVLVECIYCIWFWNKKGDLRPFKLEIGVSMMPFQFYFNLMSQKLDFQSRRFEQFRTIKYPQLHKFYKNGKYRWGQLRVHRKWLSRVGSDFANFKNSDFQRFRILKF